MRRAKNLSDEDIERILEILDGWTGRLSWELFIDSIEKRLFARYTRQALHKHARIKDAFANRKAELARRGDRPPKAASSPELQLALDHIERLTNENARLQAELSQLKDRFVRWVFNANLRGLDNEFLDQSMPPVNRRQTRLSRVQQMASPPKES